jgi:asparagine synthase (glutamine-hydrolysing)
MCGITGFVSKNFSRDQLQVMSKCLAHRGPDAEGEFFDSGVGIGLGHRRLSIIDLSEAANQPFYSKDGRFVMIFNGEVYNYRELAEKFNIPTTTTSDSEVIIELFARIGVKCFPELNGMFAIAIWDKQEEKLFLIRDRIGIKPIYYFHNGKDFAFGSELKSLLNLPIPRKIDDQAVANFLYLGYIPGSETIYRDFKKLLPGYYAIYQDGVLATYPYWWLDGSLQPETLADEKLAKARLRELLISSVNYCMISDVPLGIFLSGGTDSSVVAAIAQAGSTTPVKTFSIGFKEEKYNEAKFAFEVARYIGSDHHEFTVTEDDALHLVEKLTDIYDEPYADSSAIPTYMVSQLARSKVTVALSGDGGDELFMGYGMYYWARRLNQPLIKAFRRPIGRVLSHSGINRLRRASYLFRYPSPARRKSHIFSQEQYYFSEAEIVSILKSRGRVDIDEYFCSAKRKLLPEEEQSFFDIKNYLPEELLVKTDRASMQHSLEVRVPLLDHRLVEFTTNLSTSLKLRGNNSKYLLKEVLYDYVPAKLFDRPKWGFAIPLRIWLSKQLSYLFDKYLNREIVEESGFVHWNEVERLKREFFHGRGYLYNRLWALILLHKWFKQHNS